MKLLYLYVATWPARCITKENPIEVNFDFGYKFHYEYETNKLRCTIGNELPNDFFSLSPSKACVDSVSVIIGDNGTGKTTIASILGYLFQQGRHLPEYICIYKQNGKFILYYHFESDERPPDYSSIVGQWLDAETNQEKDDVFQHNLPFDIVYYSPYFSTNEIWPGKVTVDGKGRFKTHLCDVSTGSLVQHSNAIGGNASQVKAFQTEDVERVLRFAHQYVNDFGSREECLPLLKNDDELEPILPLPKYAQFLVDTMMLTETLEEGCRLTGDDASNGELRDIICGADSDNPIWIIASTILVYISWSLRNGSDQKELVSLKNILHKVCVVAKKFSRETANAYKGNDFADEISHIKGDVKNATVRSLMNVLRPMARVYAKSVDSRIGRKYGLAWQVDITGNKDLDDVIDVNRHLPDFESRLGKLIGTSVSLMKVSIANMSSGEMAYWTLFARLYEVLRQKGVEVQKRDLLLFLDEAETTLHPEWQRQLVSNIIWFLEEYANGRHVHVIFATHSPMILSDVPKGNVICLGDLVDGEQKKTFGANIFDLYRYGFVLKDGTVGSFAQKKIDDLVEKVFSLVRNRGKSDKRESITVADRQLVDLIADKNVARYLREWLKELDRGKDLIR